MRTHLPQLNAIGKAKMHWLGYRNVFPSNFWRNCRPNLIHEGSKLLGFIANFMSKTWRNFTHEVVQPAGPVVLQTYSGHSKFAHRICRAHFGLRWLQARAKETPQRAAWEKLSGAFTSCGPGLSFVSTLAALGN